ADCDAASGAVVELEKALESGAQYAPKDKHYASLSSEAMKATGVAKKQIQDRRDQIAIDDQKAKVETALEPMKGAVAALNAPVLNDRHFASAADAIAGVKKALEAGIELEHKLARYDAYAQGVKKSVKAAEQEVEKKKLEVAVLARKKAIEDAVAAAKTK